MNTIPVYKYPAVYARENDELEQYRASHKANIACRDAIDNAIETITAIIVSAATHRKTGHCRVWI